MNEQEVVKLMEGSRSKADWNANCDRVKDAFGGKYPSFWYSAIIQSGVATKTATKYGGKAEIKVISITSRPITIYGRPTSMPNLAKGETVVGVYDQGLGERQMVCNSLANMQSLYDSYAQGMALTLRWCISSNSESAIALPA